MSKLKTIKIKSNQSSDYSSDSSEIIKVVGALESFTAHADITSMVYEACKFSNPDMDEMELLGLIHNINDITKSTKQNLLESLPSNLMEIQKKDNSLLQSYVNDIATNIVSSAFTYAKGDLDLVLKYCKESVHLTTQLNHDSQNDFIIQNSSSPLPQKFQEYFLKIDTIMPDISNSLLEINAIKNEEIKRVILNGKTVSELANNLSKVILDAQEIQVKNTLREVGCSKEDLSNDAFGFLNSKIQGKIKTFLSMAVSKELLAMKESGIYEDIYKKTTEAFDYFIPIVFNRKTEEVKVDIEEEVQAKEVDKVEVETVNKKHNFFFSTVDKEDPLEDEVLSESSDMELEEIIKTPAKKNESKPEIESRVKAVAPTKSKFAPPVLSKTIKRKAAIEPEPAISTADTEITPQETNDADDAGVVKKISKFSQPVFLSKEEKQVSGPSF